MKISRKELLNIYGIDLPKGLYDIEVEGNNYNIYSVNDDSLGCLIVGENKEVGKVLNSRATMDKLMKEFESHKMEKHYITIEKN